ncbi:MAG: hypothetical protein AAGG44_10870 [Planctomycetota bacterium]
MHFASNALRRLTVSVLATVVLGTCVPEATAGDSPFVSMFRKKREPKLVELQAEHGPWLILAATFEGERAKAKAETLSLEIQKLLNQPAFVMKRESEAGASVLGQGERLRTLRNGEQRQFEVRKKYANSIDGDSYAVLVGEFSSTDDPQIERVLNQVHTSQPKSLGGSGQESEETTNWLIQKYRSGIWNRTDRNRKKAKGPLGAAFTTRNPLLPSDFFQTPLDDFIISLNKQVEHSLLENPGRFTVRVASFYGNGATQIMKGKAIGHQDVSTALELAAMQANKLALELRKKGVEAYQFHNRTGSFVTIGNFEKLGDQDANGNFRYNPAMVAVMQEHCGYRTVNERNAMTGAIQSRELVNSLGNIPFDIQGAPMAVPRKQTNKLYSRHLLGSNN